MMRHIRFPMRTVAAILLLFPLACAEAADIAQSRRTAIVRAIEEAAPAVVTINVVEIVAEQIADPFYQDFYDLFNLRPRQRRLRGRAVHGIGTGFLIDKQGHIVTNYHVLQDADAISSVTLPDGRNLEVKLVGVDPRADVAVLKASGTDLPRVELGDSENLLIGEWVVAIGNPFGTMMRDPQPSVSVGVVSATRRRVSPEVVGNDRLYQNMIQTDAAINPGNSGGPLVNAAGRVVGMNTMLFSKTGGHQGLGFAIPIARVRRIAEEIIDYGRRRDPWFGFHAEAVAPLSRYTRERFGIQVDSGVVVTEILTTSPAYQAGLRLGDVITEVNGEPVTTPTEVDFIAWDLFVGDPVRLRVNRRGEWLETAFLVEELAPR